jgi:hypothetical protein
MTDLFHKFTHGQKVIFSDKGTPRTGIIKHILDDNEFGVDFIRHETNTSWTDIYNADDLRDAE